MIFVADEFCSLSHKLSALETTLNRFQGHYESLMFYRPHLGCNTKKCSRPRDYHSELCSATNCFWKVKINNYQIGTIHICENYFNFFLQLFIKNTFIVFEYKIGILCFCSEDCLCNFLFKLD